MHMGHSSPTVTWSALLVKKFCVRLWSLPARTRRGTFAFPVHFKTPTTNYFQIPNFENNGQTLENPGSTLLFNPKWHILNTLFTHSTLSLKICWICPREKWPCIHTTLHFNAGGYVYRSRVIYHNSNPSPIPTYLFLRRLSKAAGWAGITNCVVHVSGGDTITQSSFILSPFLLYPTLIHCHA